MKQHVDLHTLLSQATNKDQQIASFALLSLGVIESLVGGVITASNAVELFFHADNCLFVRKQLRQKAAEEIMSRGVQLPDIFDALSAEEAQREFQRELAAMRLLCLKLLGDMKLAA
jgi:RNA-binding protein YlmH